MTRPPREHGTHESQPSARAGHVSLRVACVLVACLLVACLLVACNAFDVKLIEPPSGAPRDPNDAGTDLDAAPLDGNLPPIDGSNSGQGGAGTSGTSGAGMGGAPGTGGNGGAAGPNDASVPDAAPDAGCASDDDDSGSDCCPDDPDKTEPGLCGCGQTDADEDDDSVPDCNDGCAQDPNKTAPGECGCGLRDEDAETEAGCLGPKNALVHRYRFDGSGSTAEDSAGDADADLVNATLDASGTLVLSGGTSDAFMDLDNGILSALTNATIETWLVWNGGDPWQRIFDFGNNGEAEGMQDTTGMTYLYLTPATSGTSVARLAYSTNGSANEVQVQASGPLQSGTLVHVAAVVDDTGNQLRLYIDGARIGQTTWNGALNLITDINNWIGRSQYQTDAELGATLHEVRIYDAALSDPQIALTFAQGPDPAFLEP